MTLWINGDWITGQGASRVKRNPVSGEVLWQGNDADAAQVEQACRAARAAFPRWARLSFCLLYTSDACLLYTSPSTRD